MNNVVLIGRLTKDPELKFLPGNGTAVANFTLAVDNPFKKDEAGNKQADFISIVVFGKRAETAGKYLTKGSQVGVCGRLQTRSYDAKDGTKRYVTEVVADEFQFLDSKKGSNANTQDDAPASNNYEPPMQESDDSDSEIPF